MENTEIEVKYCVNKIPDNSNDYVYIEQYYFARNKLIDMILNSLFPGLDLNTISTFRLRQIKKGDSIKYVITLKTLGELYERKEYEREISIDVFDIIKDGKIITMIIKNRFYHKYKDYIFEFDEYLNLKTKLFTCEVEFDNSNQIDVKKQEVEDILANHFKLDYKDVSLDKKYKNSNLQKYFG